jgi:hypothetical protein
MRLSDWPYPIRSGDAAGAVIEGELTLTPAGAAFFDAMTAAAADPAQLQGWLAGLTYKPGWSWRIVADDYRCNLAISVDTLDTDDLAAAAAERRPPRPVRIGFTFAVPGFPYDGRPEFVRWWRGCLRQCELHESDEWSRDGGVPIADPHRNDKPLPGGNQ